MKVKVSSPYLFKSFLSLNCIKDLSVILIFAMMSHIFLFKNLQNQWQPAKVLNSEFYLSPHSKPHLQNYLIDLIEFLTQTVQSVPKIEDINGSQLAKMKKSILGMSLP